MTAKENIIVRIKTSVKRSEPDAMVILYGSFARGDNHATSDLDLLVLLDKDKITRDDEIRIKYPLYDIEFDTGQIISTLVLTRKDWMSRHKITPFYMNMTKEGIIL